MRRRGDNHTAFVKPKHQLRMQTGTKLGAIMGQATGEKLGMSWPRWRAKAKPEKDLGRSKPRRRAERTGSVLAQTAGESKITNTRKTHARKTHLRSILTSTHEGVIQKLNSTKITPMRNHYRACGRRPRRFGSHVALIPRPCLHKVP